MMKYLFPIALVLVAGILGTVYLLKGSESESFEQEEVVETSEMPAASTGDEPNAASGTAPAGTPVQQPVAPAPTPSGYTMAQVAAHADASSCWTVIEGKVYDLTSWIKQHPGGSRAILSLCGRDGTSTFNRQHGGQSRPEQELASYLLGNLAS